MYKVITKCEDCSHEKICSLKNEFECIEPDDPFLKTSPNFEVEVSCWNFSSKMDKEIELLNRIIATAVQNGGDLGGPYHNAEEELKESMEEYLTHRHLDNYGIRFVDLDYPFYFETLQFVPNGGVVR